MLKYAASGDRMVVGAFPAFKLGALVLKQVSKPLANVVKARAKSSPFFRTYVCMPPAQFYHWCEVKMKMWTMNLGKPVNIPKLNENMAIELGAELLGEGVIFVTAAAILVFEYVRNSRKESAKEEQRVQELARIQEELKDLYFAKAKQEAQLREVVRFLHLTNPTGCPISESNYNISDIPEHHRLAVVEEESWSVLGSMKGLIWSAVDILLPPVNQPNESPAELPHPPDTKKVRLLLVPDPDTSSASQKSPTASKSSTSSNASVDSKSNSSNPSNSNSRPSGSGGSGTGPTGTDKSKLPAST